MASQPHPPVQAAARPLDPAWAAEVDSVLAADNVPGAAISVVTPHGTFEHFYGVVRAGSTEAPTRSTGFQLCSLTKAYVATLALCLEHKGRLDLDDPVARVVPELAFEPAWLTGEIRMRDLLANRLGLQRGGLADFGLAAHYGYDELARRIGHMRRTGPFRGVFSYCNPAFGVAVLALERLTGRGFGALLDEELLAPAGLVDTVLGPEARLRQGRAHAHTIDRSGSVVEVDEPDDWVRPGAGGLMSTAADQQRWLRLNLDRGMLDDRRLVPEAVWGELWQPHVALPRGQREFFLGDPEAPMTAYGLGWFLSSYGGRFMASHTGGGVGWRTRVALLPDDGIAVSVLLNVDGKTGVVIQNHLLDRCLGMSPRPWVDIVRADRAARAADAEARIGQITPPTRAAWPTSGLAGRYRNAESGPAVIELGDRGLRITFEDGPAWDGWLQPVGGPVFEHQISGPIGTYDGPEARPPRVRFEGHGLARHFEHSSMGEFVRC